MSMTFHFGLQFPVMLGVKKGDVTPHLDSWFGAMRHDSLLWGCHKSYEALNSLNQAGFTTGFLTCLHSLLPRGKQTLSLIAEGRSPYVETRQGMHQSIIAPSCHNILCWWAITHLQQKESKLWKLNKCFISEIHPAVCPVNLLENTSNLNIIGLDKLAIISMYTCVGVTTYHKKLDQMFFPGDQIFLTWERRACMAYDFYMGT